MIYVGVENSMESSKIHGSSNKTVQVLYRECHRWTMKNRSNCSYCIRTLQSKKVSLESAPLRDLNRIASLDNDVYHKNDL